MLGRACCLDVVLRLVSRLLTVGQSRRHVDSRVPYPTGLFGLAGHSGKAKLRQFLLELLVPWEQESGFCCEP